MATSSPSAPEPVMRGTVVRRSYYHYFCILASEDPGRM